MTLIFQGKIWKFIDQFNVRGNINLRGRQDNPSISQSRGKTEQIWRFLDQSESAGNLNVRGNINLRGVRQPLDQPESLIFRGRLNISASS